MCKLLWLLTGAVWLAGSAGGLAWLGRYSGTPGESRQTGGDWPVASRLVRSGEKFSLLLFAHPECPCSRASLEELGRLLARSGDRMKARVLFTLPREMKGEWEETALWRQARGIPGVEAVADVDGAEARVFHAATSGDTFVYDETGHLVFHGGITAARGHSGDNEGRSRIEALVEERGLPGSAVTPVFGCPLEGGGEIDRSGES